MTSRYTAIAKFVGARINIVITDTQPAYRSDRTVSSWTTVSNAGRNDFMRDGGGWDFLPHNNREFCDAVYAAAAPLFAEGRTVSPRAQNLADYRRMIAQQIKYVRNASAPDGQAHCLGVLRDYLKTRSYLLATA